MKIKVGASPPGFLKKKKTTTSEKYCRNMTKNNIYTRERTVPTKNVF
jgi:hypothetical protein